MLKKIISSLEKLKNPEKARGLQRFFKTGKGEYGEGDVFWGITVPKQREVAKKFFKEESLQDIEKLLHSKVHEHRLTALIMLVLKYKSVGAAPCGRPKRDKHGGLSLQRQIVDLYLRNTKWINNWDLVDLSAPNIVGDYIFRRGGYVTLPMGRVEKPAPTILLKLAHSTSLWERRIAVLATFTAIRQNNFVPTIKISEILLHDPHDLIHKAVGWMLREAGKRDKKTLLEFLNKHAHEMPRVMLRYAIEKFNITERKKYLLSQLILHSAKFSTLANDTHKKYGTRSHDAARLNL